jgi:hypothetical protein
LPGADAATVRHGGTDRKDVSIAEHGNKKCSKKMNNEIGVI